MQLVRYIFCFFGITLLLGCARPETVEVSGTVTWNATPIPNGDILFAAMDPHVAAAAGKIEDGNFKFRCKPGDKRVDIRSYRLTGKKTSQGNPGAEMYIPERYNYDSKLTINVTFDGKNKFDFALKP